MIANCRMDMDMDHLFLLFFYDIVNVGRLEDDDPSFNQLGCQRTCRLGRSFFFVGLGVLPRKPLNTDRRPCLESFHPNSVVM